MDFEKVQQQILNVNKGSFEELALQIFNFQSNNCSIYAQYLKHINVDAAAITSIDKLPFLPIELFKEHKITSTNKYKKIFESSGTTAQAKSKHFVHSIKWYEEVVLKGFEHFYGNPNGYIFLALLPGYSKNKSSLIHMVKYLMAQSNHKLNGFYLDDFDKLKATIELAKKSKRKIILIGVTHALLALAEQGQIDLSNAMIMETGGMKGKGKELVRDELHQILRRNFNANKIRSEYGMTELMSQAYSKSKGIFKTPPWLKFMVRDIHDPLGASTIEGAGPLNVIDLANLHTCSFIATNDLCSISEKQEIEILGRMDNADIRGCNLLVTN